MVGTVNLNKIYKHGINTENRNIEPYWWFGCIRWGNGRDQGQFLGFWLKQVADDSAINWYGKLNE